MNPTLKFTLASLAFIFASVLFVVNLVECMSAYHARTKSQAAVSKALEDYYRSEQSIKEIVAPASKIEEWSKASSDKLLQISFSNSPCFTITSYDWTRGATNLEAVFTNLEVQSLWEPVLAGKSNGFWRVKFKEP